MGDGDPATTAELVPLCNLPDAEICASTTDLAGILVNNTDLMNDGLEAACEISLDDVELQTCPAGTALAGVAINSTSPDTNPADGIPDICTVSGLEICPMGTDQVGHFVMGDGDLTTTAELVPLCNLPDAEICASTTDLAGILVNNTDLMNDGLEAACEISLDDVELETCPAGTPLVGVAVPDNGDPNTFPAVCNLSGLDKCPMNSDLPGVFVMDTDGNTVFDTILPDTTERVCNLPEPPGTILYVTNAGNSTVEIYDINNPTAPVRIGEFNAGNLNNPQGIATHGTTLYVTNVGDDTVEIYDISIASAPVRIGEFNAGNLNNPQGIATQGTTLYVVNTGDETVEIYDISTSNCPCTYR